MSADLRTLLRQHATRPTSPVDVDELFDRVGRRRRRRAVVGAAAAIALVATTVGVVQLVAEPPPAPMIEEVPDRSLESSLMNSGALDRGQDAVLRLDPDTDERLRGAVVAELTVDADIVAVAADRAIGIRRGETLTILLDGEEVASGQLDGSSGDEVDWWGGDALAFDTDGTLWTLRGRDLVGLRRDGEVTTRGGALAPLPGPEGGVGLRVTQADVSILIHDVASGEQGLSYDNFDVPLTTQVVPVIGDDPLAGTVSMEVPSRLASGPSNAFQYLVERAAGLTSELLVAATVVGDVAAELDWSDLPDEDAGYQSGFAQSQVVAGTAASLQWFDLYDGSFLTVTRADGTALVALVESGPHPSLSVSPDGAVHLVVRHESDTLTVRTLLTADLRPLAGPPIEDVAPPSTPPPAPPPDGFEPAASECDELPDGAVLIDEVAVDLDRDGQPDPVRVIRRPWDPAWDLVVACFADGTGATTTLDPPERLEVVDLAGTPGIAGVRATEEGADSYEIMGLREFWFESPMIDWTPDGNDGFSGMQVPLVDGSTPGAGRVTTFGCRAVADGAGAFEVVLLQVDGVDEVVTLDDGAPEYRGTELDVTYVVRRVNEDWFGVSEPTPPIGLTAAGGAARPVEVLAGLDASWLCRP